VDKIREIMVGDHRLCLDDNNILYFIGNGNYDEKTALEIKEAGLRLANMVEGTVNVILNHNMAGKPSPRARAIFKEMTEHEKFRKIAHCGIHPVARVLASFVIGISKKQDMRFFATEKEALAWLKE
jgi:hypothetical protein